MKHLKINGIDIKVEDGISILDAAKGIGVEIPTMCYAEGCAHLTSCMVCVVQDMVSGKLIPACSAPVEDGLEIETENDEVKEARRVALELMLSEHVGDCEAPCRQICPTFMNIPKMIHYIEKGELRDAIITVKEHIALPAVLGRVCHAPCEKGCRRGRHDSPVSIRLLERYVADVDLASDSPYLPEKRPATGKSVAIVGAGPAGLAAAYELLQNGHKCIIYDKNENPGGPLYTSVSEEVLPKKVYDSEIDIIRKLGCEFKQNCEIGIDIAMEQLTVNYDAVIIAAGVITEENAKCFGVKYDEKGIDTDYKNYMTDRDGVFAIGDAVLPAKKAVRAVEEGRTSALVVNSYLFGEEAVAPHRAFNSRFGKLIEGDMDEFMKIASDAKRVEPESNGFSDEEAVKESERCLYCDCRKPDECKLRGLSDKYKAKQARYSSKNRKPFERIIHHEKVIYEPGKCVRCGLCVQITENEQDALGLTFVGRGFDVKVDVPFNETMDKALNKLAEECINKCPTAALSYL